jgi:hypothetical protein
LVKKVPDGVVEAVVAGVGAVEGVVAPKLKPDTEVVEVVVVAAAAPKVGCENAGAAATEVTAAEPAPDTKPVEADTAAVVAGVGAEAGLVPKENPGAEGAAAVVVGAADIPKPPNPEEAGAVAFGGGAATLNDEK